MKYDGLGASGDSGGPILGKLNGTYYILGVLSGSNDDKIYIRGYSCYTKVNTVDNKYFLNSVGSKYNIDALK